MSLFFLLLEFLKPTCQFSSTYIFQVFYLCSYYFHFWVVLFCLLRHLFHSLLLNNGHFLFWFTYQLFHACQITSWVFHFRESLWYYFWISFMLFFFSFTSSYCLSFTAAQFHWGPGQCFNFFVFLILIPKLLQGFCFSSLCIGAQSQLLGPIEEWKMQSFVPCGLQVPRSIIRH